MRLVEIQRAQREVSRLCPQSFKGWMLKNEKKKKEMKEEMESETKKERERERERERMSE